MHRKNIKRVMAFCMSMLLLIIASGCQTNKTDNKEENKDTGEKKLTIVTSFYPIYIATINITKDIEGVEVVNLTEPITGCLHDYSLTPKDMKTLEKAEIFVINGAGMEAFMEDVTKEMNNLKVIDASEGIPLLEGDTDEGTNPHVWVSITHAATQVKTIQKQLSSMDSLHGEAYEKNADIYIEKLENQKKKMHEVLDFVTHKDIITFHEAFPYFAQEFNLNIAGVVEREPGSEPSAKELADTIEQIKKMGITALFAEPQYSKDAASTIANETGAKLFTLDPVVTGPMEADAYLEIMDKNLEVLKEALK